MHSSARPDSSKKTAAWSAMVQERNAAHIAFLYNTTVTAAGAAKLHRQLRRDIPPPLSPAKACPIRSIKGHSLVILLPDMEMPTTRQTKPTRLVVGRMTKIKTSSEANGN